MISPVSTVVKIVVGVVLLVALYLAWGAWHDRGGSPDARVAHDSTIVQEKIVYYTDTVYQTAKARAAKAVVTYRTIAKVDRVTDTLWVREALAACDTVIVADSTALAKADSTIAARDTLALRIRTELAIAQRSGHRLGLRASALYDPIAKIPAASLEGSLRLTNRLALIVRGDQRFAPGERPRAYAGVSLSF